MTLREDYPLDPKKIIKKTIQFSLPFIFFIAVLAILLGLISILFALILLVLSFLIFFAVRWWSAQYFKVYFYDMTDKGLDIRKGVFFPKTITVPLEKVSDVYIDQDLLDRYFGLYDLHFSSASISSGFFAHIDGMNKDTTDRLHAFLLRSFKASKGESEESTALNNATSQKTIASFKPAPIGFWLRLIGAELGFAIFFLFLFAAFLGLGLILFVPIALIVAFFVKKDYEVLTYELRGDGVWIHKGWLTPSDTMIFYGNIQNTDIVKSFIDRLFGVETVSIKSMSFLSATAAVMPYLKIEDADRFQQLLKDQIGKKAVAQSGKSATIAVQTSAAAKVIGTSQMNPYKLHFMASRMIYLPILYAILIIVEIGATLLGNLGSTFQLIMLLVLSFIGVLCTCVSFFGALLNSYSYKYWLGDEGLEIQVGILGTNKEVIRYDKIQDIEMQCSFLGSLIGLCTVCVQTGSRDIVSRNRDSSASATSVNYLPALSIKDAHELRTKLLTIAGISYPSNPKPLRVTLPLSKNKPLKKTVGKISLLGVQLLVASLAVALVMQSLISLLFWGFTALVAIYLSACFVLYYPYEKEYLRKYFYDENGESLVIHKGVFGWDEIIVPFRNIQSVYVSQDWYDVYFGLWDVWITTVAATSASMAHIDGLESENAEQLARLLADHIEKARA